MTKEYYLDKYSVKSYKNDSEFEKAFFEYNPDKDPNG